MLNPMAQIIQDARYCLITDQTVTMTQALRHAVGARSSRWASASSCSVTSVVYFRRRSPYFAEEA